MSTHCFISPRLNVSCSPERQWAPFLGFSLDPRECGLSHRKTKIRATMRNGPWVVGQQAPAWEVSVRWLQGGENIQPGECFLKRQFEHCEPSCMPSTSRSICQYGKQQRARCFWHLIPSWTLSALLTTALLRGLWNDQAEGTPASCASKSVSSECWILGSQCRSAHSPEQCDLAATPILLPSLQYGKKMTYCAHHSSTPENLALVLTYATEGQKSPPLDSLKAFYYLDKGWEREL